MPLSTIGMLFGANSGSGGTGLSLLTAGGGTSGVATASAGSIKAALVNAEKNEAKQLAQTARDPQVQKDLARYEKVVKSAKTIDDVLNDPVARKVLMTATGLRADIDNVALAKRGMLSDPADSKSVAARLASVKGAFIDFAKTYNLAKYGLDRLHPQINGAEGRWRIAFEREGAAIEAMLEVKKVRGGTYEATIDGIALPVTVEGDTIILNILWRDSTDELRTSMLTGVIGKNGLSGDLVNDGETQTSAWSAAPYFASSLSDIRTNYIAEKRLDLLDQQMPGLGSAVLFKQMAPSFKDAVDVLGSGLGREVITTAFNIPKQIAIQSMEAQEKAINQRISFPKLQNAGYVDIIAQRYLLTLNGGLGGITA